MRENKKKTTSTKREKKSKKSVFVTNDYPLTLLPFNPFTHLNPLFCVKKAKKKNR